MTLHGVLRRIAGFDSVNPHEEFHDSDHSWSSFLASPRAYGNNPVRGVFANPGFPRQFRASRSAT